MFAKVKYLLAIGLLFLIPSCATGQATGATLPRVITLLYGRMVPYD